MKMSELVFDKKSLKINGFTDLGVHTPLHQKNQKGDHALVLMFQPFQGKWVQTVACFLSRGAASSTFLHQIIIETIILLEKSGFFVDAVTTDGAAWNNVSCQHVYDENRLLWFLSDFPHLIKNLRNSLVKYREIWVKYLHIKLFKY